MSKKDCDQGSKSVLGKASGERRPLEVQIVTRSGVCIVKGSAIKYSRLFRFAS